MENPVESMEDFIVNYKESFEKFWLIYDSSML